MNADKGLTVDDVTVRYGGVVANDHVSLQVAVGQVVGLIGPNGAGKTTFVDAVSGFAHCTGKITLDGKPMASLPPHRRRAAGLSRTWQSGELFSNLTVEQNIMVALQPGGLRALVRDLGRVSRARDVRVAAVLDLVGLGGMADTVAGDLPLGRQKLVGIARALAGDSTVLLLDEPAAGLDSGESLELGATIRALADAGHGILLIDHDLSLMLKVSDSLHVMHFGSIIYAGDPAAAVRDPAVVEAYLGASIESEVG